MQFLILAAGKPALGYAREGVELYLNRLKPFGKTELKLVKDGSSKDVSERLLAASEGCLRIAMDERGELWTTEKLVKLARDWQMRSVRPHRVPHRGLGRPHGRTAFPCGHILALSKFTLQHELRSSSCWNSFTAAIPFWRERRTTGKRLKLSLLPR